MLPADFDELFEAAPSGTTSRARAAITREQFYALAAREVPCGYFTLTLTDGSQRKFRVRLERGNWITGQRTLSIWRKIETSDDRPGQEWETLGVVSPTGFTLFKRWRNQWESRWAAAVWALAHGVQADRYSLAIEPRCWMTMRELKTPAARASGLCETWQKNFRGQSWEPTDEQ